MKKQEIKDFRPLTAELHDGNYTVCITGTEEYSPIIAHTSDKSFTIPFSRFRDYFMEDDPEVLINRMSVFERCHTMNSRITLNHTKNRLPR